MDKEKKQSLPSIRDVERYIPGESLKFAKPEDSKKNAALKIFNGIHVFVVGNDDSVFDFSSPLFQKVSSYTKLFGRLTIICRTRKIFSKTLILQGPLTIYAVGTRNPLFFLVRALALGCGALRKEYFFPRVVTADNPFEEGLVAWLLARLFRVSLQLQVHTDIMSPFFRRASWKERARYMLAIFLIPRADSVRVVSDRIRRSLIKAGVRNQLSDKLTADSRKNQPDQDSKIMVLPIWTDIKRFLRAKPGQLIEERFRRYTFKIVAVGRFVNKEKNFSMLLEIMRDFVKICPRTLLALIGDGPDKTNYQQLVVNYRLQDNVIIERVPSDALPSFLKSFDIFALSSNYEGWGRVVIEAMAAGLPVVMTDVGLAGEVVKNNENGIVVPVGDKKAFIGALKQLAQDTTKRARLKNAARKTILAMSPKTQEEYNLSYKDSFLICG